MDENGVWVIYRNGSRRNIHVAKLADDLSIQKTVVIRFGQKPKPATTAGAAAAHRRQLDGCGFIGVKVVGAAGASCT